MNAAVFRKHRGGCLNTTSFDILAESTGQLLRKVVVAYKVLPVHIRRGRTSAV